MVTVAITSAANDDNNIIDEDDNNDNNIEDNEDKEDGQPGNDGRRGGEVGMATMVSPQTDKTSANDNSRARPPIAARCRRIERGMMAAQSAGSSKK